MASAGTVTIDFAAETAKFTAELKKVNSQLGAMQKDFNGFADTLGTVGKAFLGVFSATAVASFARQAFLAADAMGDAAARAGVAVESLSRLAYAAEQSDVEFATLTIGIKNLQLAMSRAASGSKEAEEALGRLGLKARELSDLQLEQQLALIADRFQGVASPADRTRIAVELFGKSGQELVPLLSQGAEGLRKLTEEADRLGITLNAETAAAIGATDLALKKLWATLRGFATSRLGGIALAIIGEDGLDELTRAELQMRRLNAERERIVGSSGPGGPAAGSGFAARLREIDAELGQLVPKLREMRALQAQQSNIDAITAAADARMRAAFAASIGGLDALSQRAGGDAAKEAERNATIDRELEHQRILFQQRRLADAQELEAKRVQRALLEQVDQEYLDGRIQAYADTMQLRFDTESTWASAMAEIRRQYGIEEIQFEELKAATLQQIGVSLAQSGIQIATALFGQNKKIALAAAAVNIAVGASEALKLPFPANLAAVAKVLAQGAQLTSAIKSASIGNVVSNIASSGGSVAPAQNVGEQVATGAQQGRVTQVVFNGPVAGEQAFIDLIKKASDRDVVIFSSASRQAQELRGAA